MGDSDESRIDLNLVSSFPWLLPRSGPLPQLTNVSRAANELTSFSLFLPPVLGLGDVVAVLAEI